MKMNPMKNHSLVWKRIIVTAKIVLVVLGIAVLMLAAIIIYGQLVSPKVYINAVRDSSRMRFDIRTNQKVNRIDHFTVYDEHKKEKLWETTAVIGSSDKTMSIIYGIVPIGWKELKPADKIDFDKHSLRFVVTVEYQYDQGIAPSSGRSEQLVEVEWL